jgi:hypothetical protein
MTAREHARLLGLLMWIFAGFQIVTTAAFVVIYPIIFKSFILAEIERSPRHVDEMPPEFLMPMIVVIMVVAFVFSVLLSIPKIVAGFGLRNDRSWAKVWAIIACCLAVLSFPFGTALGVYGFIFIFGEKGKEYFDVQPAANFPPPPPAAGSWG